MMRAFATLLVTAAALLQVQGEEAKIIGARLERCSSCRMAKFDKCKAWIDTEAPQYRAVEVTHVHGMAPMIHWLDAFGDTVEKTRVKETDSVEDVAAYFHAKGITKETPSPDWQEKPAEFFNPTENCLAFRRHTIHRDRLPRDDQPCSYTIAPGSGIGYCECANGKRPEIRIGKKRSHVTCEQVCVLGRAPWEEEEL